MFQRHVTRCLIAGFVALLPVGGLILTIVYLEYSIASGWLADQRFYVPGLGLLAATLALYVIGLVVTTVVGRWLWRRLDGLLAGLPGFGPFYSTLKQVLGYSSGEDAIFREVVLVRRDDTRGEQLGLVTQRFDVGELPRAVVFVPGAPNPTSGELLVVDPDDIRRIDLAVDEALKGLVSLGKTSIEPDQLVARAAGGNA